MCTVIALLSSLLLRDLKPMHIADASLCCCGWISLPSPLDGVDPCATNYVSVMYLLGAGLGGCWN